MEHPLVYQPSGRLAPLTVPQLLGGGLVAGVLVGAAYGVAACLNPLKMANPLILIAAGLVLATVMRAVVRWAKCRNPWLAAGGGAVAGAAAVYASWVAWIFALAGGSAESLFFGPGQLRVLAGLLAVDGVWSVLGMSVNGTALRALWTGEGMLLVALAAVWPALMVLRTPYSEDDGSWAVQHETMKFSEIKPGRREAFTGALRRGSFGGLAQLKPAPDGAACFTACTRRFGKDSGPLVFLTLVSVDTKAQPSGKLVMTSTQLTRNLAVETAVWTKMRDQVAQAAAPTRTPVAGPPTAPQPAPSSASQSASQTAASPAFKAAPAPAPDAASAAPNFLPPTDLDDRTASPNGLPGMPPAA